MAKIDPKLLKGLKYCDHEVKIEMEEGRKVTRYIPIERDLTPEDILASKDYGDRIVIVTADGKKYSLEKRASPKTM